MIQSGGFMTGIICVLDGFVSFSFKVLEPYSKELSNIDTKNTRIIRIVFLQMQELI